MDAFEREKYLFNLAKTLHNGLHYRCLLSPHHHDFPRTFAALYPTISREDAVDLLSWQAWQPRLVGAYICGFRGWHDFDGCISRLLVRDELIFASVAYSFALARFALPSSSTALSAYLWNNFSGRCTDYSSIWHAIAALQWIDEQKGTDFYERYSDEWEEKVESGRATLTCTGKEEARDLMRRALSQEYISGARCELQALVELSSNL